LETYHQKQIVQNRGVVMEKFLKALGWKGSNIDGKLGSLDKVDKLLEDDLVEHLQGVMQQHYRELQP
jgi:hypothetical protein